MAPPTAPGRQGAPGSAGPGETRGEHPPRSGGESAAGKRRRALPGAEGTLARLASLTAVCHVVTSGRRAAAARSGAAAAPRGEAGPGAAATAAGAQRPRPGARAPRRPRHRAPPRPRCTPPTPITRPSPREHGQPLSVLPQSFPPRPPRRNLWGAARLPPRLTRTGLTWRGGGGGAEPSRPAARAPWPPSPRRRPARARAPACSLTTGPAPPGRSGHVTAGNRAPPRLSLARPRPLRHVIRPLPPPGLFPWTAGRACARGVSSFPPCARTRRGAGQRRRRRIAAGAGATRR